MTEDLVTYGTEDASYIAAGKYDGIKQLVDCFYNYMDRLPEAKKIRDMHPGNLSHSKDRLTLFLSGWLGGPRLYQEKHGPIRIPQFHKHLNITEVERDAWLSCMKQAIAEQNFADDFKIYLLKQLFVPAERIRMVSQANRSEQQSST